MFPLNLNRRRIERRSKGVCIQTSGIEYDRVPNNRVGRKESVKALGPDELCRTHPVVQVVPSQFRTKPFTGCRAPEQRDGLCQNRLGNGKRVS
jgi:hypothetical protein